MRTENQRMREEPKATAAELSGAHDAAMRRLSSVDAIRSVADEPIARIATEVFVPLAGGPGTLAGTLAAISDAGCNIEGYAEVSGVLHCLTENSGAARTALAARELLPSEADVVVLRVADRLGIAKEVFRRIAESGINVLFSYLATNNRMVIGVSDPVAAARLLNS